VLVQHSATTLHDVTTSKTTDSENLKLCTVFIVFPISGSTSCDSRAYVTDALRNTKKINNGAMNVHILGFIGSYWRYSVNLIYPVFILFLFKSWNIFVWFYCISLCVLHRCVGTAVSSRCTMDQLVPCASAPAIRSKKSTVEQALWNVMITESLPLDLTLSQFGAVFIFIEAGPPTGLEQ
jgi:hypothetical protein